MNGTITKENKEITQLRKNKMHKKFKTEHKFLKAKKHRQQMYTYQKKQHKNRNNSILNDKKHHGRQEKVPKIMHV